MSENPFEKPVPASTAEAYKTPESQPSGAPKSIPTTLMVISIVGLILGVFGLLGVCMGGISLAMSDMIADVMPDEESKDAMRKLFDLQFIPNLIQLALSTIVAPLLLAGSIGCLTRKPWSRGVMKLAIVGSIISYLFGMGAGAWMMLFHSETLSAPNANQPGGQAMTMVIQIFTYGFLFAILVFFIWAFFAMGSKKINDFYA